MRQALPVRWIDQQAVVTLPQHIHSTNAGQVREQLLRAINGGAAVLIADLAATVSCDYAGAEAVARAYQRAVASGADLRLVIGAEVVHRAFRVNGLHRLIPIYSTLDAALAAARDASRLPGGPRRRAAAAQPAADRVDGPWEPLDRAVDDILSAAVGLHEAIDLPRNVIAQRITDSLCRLDDAIREIRGHVLINQSRLGQPDPAAVRMPHIYERAAAAVKNAALLRQRLVDSAHALHAAAVETAALLEQRGGLAGEPGPVDYPTDIKRWQIIAEQAEEMAKRWEQRSLPAVLPWIAADGPAPGSSARYRGQMPHR